MVAADLFMCPEGRPTCPFTRPLLRQGGRQDTPLLMTWMATNRKAWDGWTWPFITVGWAKTCITCSATFRERMFHELTHCPNVCRQEVEFSQRLLETRPGSTQPEDRGALSGLQDPVWWKPCCGSGIHAEGADEKGTMAKRLPVPYRSPNIWCFLVQLSSSFQVMSSKDFVDPLAALSSLRLPVSFCRCLQKKRWFWAEAQLTPLSFSCCPGWEMLTTWNNTASLWFSTYQVQTEHFEIL